MEGEADGPRREAHAAEAHAHAPQAFIWKYVFSKDHKVIGIQYYVTAMFMALIAGLLAMLIRAAARLAGARTSRALQKLVPRRLRRAAS